MSRGLATYADLNAVATHLRDKLTEKQYILLFAYNGIGKTRLSMEFGGLGKNGEARDTLYFNAFTEDLFYWDNDLEHDERRVTASKISPPVSSRIPTMRMASCMPA